MKNKSQKGVKGTVGAPQKSIKFPYAGKFSIEKLKTLNKGVCCELTIRKRVESCVEGTTEPRLELVGYEKQDGVGRPTFLYARKGTVKVNLTDTKPARATRKTRVAKTVTTPVADVVPTPAPITITQPPLATPVRATAPTATTPVLETVLPAEPTPSDVTEGSEVPAAFGTNS